MPLTENGQRRWWTKWSRTQPQCQPGVQRLPSFYIIGPPRTGTSWLYEILRKRTLLPSRTKETRFFDEHFDRGLSWYQNHFAVPNSHSRMGEVAPTYFASPQARRRIRNLTPKARIVCIFRDPVERIFSLYRVKRAYGMIPWTFEQALRRDSELTESSRYATYLRGWQEDFGAEQVLPTLYDDLRDSPQNYVDQLADFIGIPRFHLSAAEKCSVHASERMTHPRSYVRAHGATKIADWLKARHFGPFVAAVKSSPISKLFLGGGPAFSGLSRELAVSVRELFRCEIETLETILGRDLSHWKPFNPDLLSAELSNLDSQYRAAA